MGLLESLKTFKSIEFADDKTRKILKRACKERLFKDDQFFNRLKKLALLRERDRSTRENSVKILKKLINFSKKTCKIMLNLKIDIIVSFFLEREYKHS